MLPLLAAKQRALEDDDWLEQDSLVCCPDPDERLVMRIERRRQVSLDPAELRDRSEHGDNLVSRAGLAFQSDKRPADYERLAAGAEHYGFGAVSGTATCISSPRSRRSWPWPGPPPPSSWGRPASTHT